MAGKGIHSAFGSQLSAAIIVDLPAAHLMYEYCTAYTSRASLHPLVYAVTWANPRMKTLMHQSHHQRPCASLDCCTLFRCSITIGSWIFLAHLCIMNDSVSRYSLQKSAQASYGPTVNLLLPMDAIGSVPGL